MVKQVKPEIIKTLKDESGNIVEYSAIKKSTKVGNTGAVLIPRELIGNYFEVKLIIWNIK